MRHVYVHAGGKIEALGTGLWAAPRGAVGAVGDIVETTTGAGMMTVETVCAIDVTNNTEPTPDLLGSIMTPRDKPAAKMGGTMADTSAAGMSSTAAAATGGPKKDKRTEEKEKKEAELKAKLSEKEQKKLAVCYLAA